MAVGAKTGKLVLFSVEVTPGTYSEALSARENGFSMSTSSIDVSCKADGNFGSTLPGQIQVTTTLSGPYRNDTVDRFLRAAFLDGTIIKGKYVTSAADEFVGEWVLTKYDVTGAKDGAEEFSMDLANYGEITYTAGPV